MSDKKNIQIFENADELALAAAHFIIDQASAAIKATGRFSIALSGGSTPERLFALLSQPAYRDRIKWDNVFVFWGDERAVPLDDERNNACIAKKLLLDKINIPPANIYRIHSDLTPDKAARLYEDSIEHFFKGSKPAFDLILLGMGDNGHTASLFPHTEVLKNTNDLVASVYVGEVKMYRITMTASLINAAHNVLFLVAGSGKAEMLHTILDGEKDYDSYPAQMINPHEGGSYWYIDKEAAALLMD
jgi:6-phosphogluconolactonase